MFRMRTTGDCTITLERAAHSGMYIVKVRAGVTILKKEWFDTGREAWKAYRSSPHS